MPGGRPSKYKAEYCDTVVKLMGEGLSAEACAADFDISKDTLYEWIKTIPEFSDAVGRGLSKGRKFWEVLGRAGAAGQVKGFNSSTWLFIMRNRFGWREEPGELNRAQLSDTQTDVKELLERLESYEKKVLVKDVTPKITEKKLKLLSGAQ